MARASVDFPDPEGPQTPTTKTVGRIATVTVPSELDLCAVANVKHFDPINTVPRARPAPVFQP